MKSVLAAFGVASCGVLVASGASLLAAVSCGPVAAPPPSSVPANTCASDAGCAAFSSEVPAVCAEGACVSERSFDFTLVITPAYPDPGSGSTGVTYPIPSFAAAKTMPCVQQDRLTLVPCLQIPAPIQVTGALEVASDVITAADAGAYAGGVPTSLTLPVHARYYPLWPLSVGTTPSSTTNVDAVSVGLPLEPIDGWNVVSGLSVARGPFGAPAVGWSAPLCSTALYELDVVPDYSAFPGTTTIATPQTTQDVQAPHATLTPWPFQVSRVDGSLLGFTAFLRNMRTLRAVSSVVTLQDGNLMSFQLLTFGLSSLVGGADPLQLVIDPPAGAAIPYLADTVLVDPVAPLETEPFPELPAPVAVSGMVLAPDSTPVRAAIIIDSQVGALTFNGTNTRARNVVHYSTTATTDASGHYEVSLPPGKYDAFVIPALGSNAGAGKVDLAVATPLAGNSVAAGESLQAPALGVLRGTAILADGRPMVGARVVAQAASSLAASVDPRLWPRSGSATTDSDGSYAIVLDPGTYDVLVEPALGSGFAWSTVSSVLVPAGGTQALAEITVGAPSSHQLVLIDPTDRPLAGALVRAYAPASGALPVSAGGPKPMIEIGQWTADATGQVTMLVAPPN